MSFGIKDRYNKIWWNIQFKWLDLRNKASRYADFQFGHLTCLNKFGRGGVSTFCAHELSVVDPFDRVINTSRAEPS
jgi:hypothetical protein